MITVGKMPYRGESGVESDDRGIDTPDCANDDSVGAGPIPPYGPLLCISSELNRHPVRPTVRWKQSVWTRSKRERVRRSCCSWFVARKSNRYPRSFPPGAGRNVNFTGRRWPMATVVAKTAIKRAKGWLYFLDKKGDVSRAKMARGGGKGPKGREKVVKVGIDREDGFLYFIDKNGNVAKVKMKRSVAKRTTRKTARKKPARRKAAKKKTTKKTAKKKPARRKAAKKKATKKTARKKTARKKPARRKVAKKKTVRRKAARR